MRTPDYLLLAALAAGVFFVLRRLWRRRKRGCCGCHGCQTRENCKKRSP